LANELVWSRGERWGLNFGTQKKPDMRQQLHIVELFFTIVLVTNKKKKERGQRDAAPEPQNKRRH